MSLRRLSIFSDRRAGADQVAVAIDVVDPSHRTPVFVGARRPGWKNSPRRGHRRVASHRRQCRAPYAARGAAARPRPQSVRLRSRRFRAGSQSSHRRSGQARPWIRISSVRSSACPAPEFEQFKQWLAKAQQEGRRKRLDEAPAAGMRPRSDAGPCWMNRHPASHCPSKNGIFYAHSWSSRGIVGHPWSSASMSSSNGQACASCNILRAGAVGTALPRRLRSRRGFAANERIRFVAGKCQKTTGVKGATQWRSSYFRISRHDAEQYEATSKKVWKGPGNKLADWPVEGVLAHMAGPMPEGWCVVDVWNRGGVRTIRKGVGTDHERSRHPRGRTKDFPAGAIPQGLIGRRSSAAVSSALQVQGTSHCNPFRSAFTPPKDSRKSGTGPGGFPLLGEGAAVPPGRRAPSLRNGRPCELGAEPYPTPTRPAKRAHGAV